VVVAALCGRASSSTTISRTEYWNDPDDQRLESWQRCAYDRKVRFDGTPVCCGSAVVRCVVLMPSEHIECIDSQYRNDADEPSYSEDTEKCDFLAFGDMQAPYASDRDDCD
jgi:hypothetical protein